MAVSKRLRFEVLRRDNHQCRYCGGIAPDVALTVDHVVPVALGGSDEPSNLVAACKDCNAGKSSASADAATVDDVAQDASRWAAAMRQAAEEFSREVAEYPDVYALVEAEWVRGSRPSDWTDSIDCFIKAGLPVDVIVKMARVAQNKRGEIGYRWSYFCGCCWTRIRDMQRRAQELIGQTIQPPSVIDGLPTRWSRDEIKSELRAITRNIADRYKIPESSIVDLSNYSCAHEGDLADCGDLICSYVAISELRAYLATVDGRDVRRDTAIMDELDGLDEADMAVM